MMLLPAQIRSEAYRTGWPHG